MNRVRTLESERFYARTNLKFLSRIIKLRNEVDLFIFFIGADSLLLPMLGTKVLRVKTFVIPAADTGKISSSRGMTENVLLGLTGQPSS